MDGLVESHGENAPQWYWNPYGAFEWDQGGFGFGYVVGHKRSGGLDLPDASGHLRFGDPRRSVAVAFRLFEDVPAFTSGGMGTLGIGFSPQPRSLLWLGVAAGEPYDGLGFFMHGETPLWRGFTLKPGLRFGRSEGVSESGVSIALTWSAVHR